LPEAGFVRGWFVVDLMRDGKDGLYAAMTAEYDLIVLGVMLPGLDGRASMRVLSDRVKDVTRQRGVPPSSRPLVMANRQIGATR
jgi:CheY-like chemotaxis protein